jgi:hypothetical protein
MHQVRPFTRADRDQFTELVNAHIAAVVPGWSVSTAALLAQLERNPSQYVIDPWLVEPGDESRRRAAYGNGKSAATSER